jgi:predicted Holliday junction resolvase-like endonuclease
MSNARLSEIFNDLNQILAVCPHCESVFYLSEARPYLKGQRPKTVVDRLRSENRKLDRLDEFLAEQESVLREKAARDGLIAAKASLKEIDHIFSGSGIDPHDVKVIFNPVTYVVFHGLSSKSLDCVRLLSHAPLDQSSERVLNSIEKVVRHGNYDFSILRVDEAGSISTKKCELPRRLRR